MIDFKKLPKISLNDESVLKVLFGLLPIVLGIFAILILLLLSEFKIVHF